MVVNLVEVVRRPPRFSEMEEKGCCIKRAATHYGPPVDVHGINKEVHLGFWKFYIPDPISFFAKAVY